MKALNLTLPFRNARYKLLWLLFPVLILVSSGCSPSNPNPNPNTLGFSEDQSVYFTITFNGRTITTYGYTSTAPAVNTSLSLSTRIGVSSIGTTSSQINFMVLGSSINSLLQSNGISQNLAQLDCSSFFSKDGTPLGIYEAIQGGSIVDIFSPARTIYYIAACDQFPNSCSRVTVTSIDQNYVTGTVNFYLVDGNNLIPATGSFRLHKL